MTQGPWKSAKLQILEMEGSRTAALNLWVSTPLGVKRSFHRGHLRPSENTDVYLIIYNSREIMKYNEIILWLVVTATWRTVLKDCSIRKVENHCFRTAQRTRVRGRLSGSGLYSSIWEAEIGRSLWVQGQRGLHSEFLASQDYTGRPCLFFFLKKGWLWGSVAF